MNLEPSNQTNLFGLDKYFDELINLYNKNILPNKILFSGQKGSGKSTLAYHLINYILSKDEQFPYNPNNYLINNDNKSFKLILNNTNMNFNLIDINKEKKSIDISQIRNLILNLNKSSFNNKPRFVLIDNIEFLNANSINALLKIIEEPMENIFFLLIHNNKKILPTLTSRCLNFKIKLSNSESLIIANKLIQSNFFESINKDLINYYMTPGLMYNLFKFGENNNIDLSNLNLKGFLSLLIENNYFKKDDFIKYIIYDFIEFYFTKRNNLEFNRIFENYNYFLKKIFNLKSFNLDEESLLIEFETKILNG